MDGFKYHDVLGRLIMRRELIRRSNDVSDPASPHASLATLIVSIICASVSLIAASLTCWWFAIMKRRLRHRLIMLLIVSDMGKAMWFFVGPLVALVNGPVKSPSPFCQASGFFLAWATEASDFSALMLALHLVTCVFRPPTKGHRGLYNLRRYILASWFILPLLAASLGFVADDGYHSYGAYCYLKEQPVWYRLALAWIPRYIVLITIFSVAVTITMHVHIKYRRINHLEHGGLGDNLDSEESKTALGSIHRNDSLSHQKEPHTLPQTDSRPATLNSWQDSFQPGPPPRRASIIRDFASNSPVDMGQARQPASESTPPTPTPVSRSQSIETETTDDTSRNSGIAQTSGTDSTDELLVHRHAIEKQVHLLFIYPTSYAIVWLFPFVSQCFQLSGKHFQQQPLWLRILTTGVLASQAGVDAAVFCYRERPWKRERGRSIIPLDLLRRLQFWKSASKEVAGATSLVDTTSRRPTDQKDSHPVAKGSLNWWEEEGRRRRDSVWMGTDSLIMIKSRQQQDEEAIVEDEGPT